MKVSNRFGWLCVSGDTGPHERQHPLWASRPLIAYQCIVCIFAGGWCGTLAAQSGAELAYCVVDTGQRHSFSDSRQLLAAITPDQPFFGQDACYQGFMPKYADNQDGTITDLNTGLMWQKTPDLVNKSSFAAARRGAASCRLGGYTDWRLPSIKELYSLIDFSGGMALDPAKPYLETRYFDFVYGDPDKGQREIDAQYWSSTEYVGLTMRGNATVFGVNFADGRIKGYPRDRALQFVRYVRGNPDYGKNSFVDNLDGTITDQATGLMWSKSDSGRTMNWEQSLAFAERSTLAGYDDWRLPNAKELQSIVDYTRAPDARNRDSQGPAIDPIFDITEVESYFWTGTTHLENRRNPASMAVYVCFGRSMGYMSFGRFGEKQRINVHGAGAQRSDPKSGDPADPRWSQGHGPQGDDIRIDNYVRIVRNVQPEMVQQVQPDRTPLSVSQPLPPPRRGLGFPPRPKPFLRRSGR
jgi:hypothetical protein